MEALLGMDTATAVVVYVAAASIFVSLVVVVIAVTWPRSPKHDRIQQIAHFGPARSAATVPRSDVPSAGSVIARTALAASSSLLRKSNLEGRIALRLQRAGMKLRPQEWVLLRVGVAAITAGLGYAVGGWFPGLLSLMLGWLLTQLYQTIRIERRATRFTEQLPDALQMVIGSIKAGFSLPQALDALVREVPEPASVEFGRALAEHRLGADISEALERMAQRNKNADLIWAVMAVRIQREVGGNIAEVLQTAVDTMRERARLRRHARALSAEGRLSAWILIGLPAVLALFMFIFRRDYMMPLVTDPRGVSMLIIGGLLFVIGVFWMIKVIKVEA